MKFSHLLRMKSTIFVSYLLLVATPVLLVGSTGYFGIVIPLKEKLLVQQTRILGRTVNAAITERAASLALVLGAEEAEDLLEDGRLPKIVEVIRHRFPDFVSLELLDGSGEILAMAGELCGLPGSGPPKEAAGKLTPQSGRPTNSDWIFRYDPAGQHFLITTVRPVPGNDASFARARFSRKPLQEVLESVSRETGGVAGLAQISDSNGVNWHDVAASGSRLGADIALSPPARVDTFGNWLAAPRRAEMRLSVPGWVVTLDANPQAVLSSNQIVWTGAGALLALLLVTAAIVRPHRTRYAMAGHIDPVDEPQGHGEASNEDAPRPVELHTNAEDYFRSDLAAQPEEIEDDPATGNEVLGAAQADDDPFKPMFPCEEWPDDTGWYHADEFLSETEPPTAGSFGCDLDEPTQTQKLSSDVPAERELAQAWHADAPQSLAESSLPEPAEEWPEPPAQGAVIAEANLRESTDRNHVVVQCDRSAQDPSESVDEEYLIVSWDEPSSGIDSNSSSEPPLEGGSRHTDPTFSGR